MSLNFSVPIIFGGVAMRSLNSKCLILLLNLFEKKFLEPLTKCCYLSASKTQRSENTKQCQTLGDLLKLQSGRFWEAKNGHNSPKFGRLESSAHSVSAKWTWRLTFALGRLGEQLTCPSVSFNFLEEPEKLMIFFGVKTFNDICSLPATGSAPLLSSLEQELRTSGNQDH